MREPTAVKLQVDEIVEQMVGLAEGAYSPASCPSLADQKAALRRAAMVGWAPAPLLALELPLNRGRLCLSASLLPRKAD